MIGQHYKAQTILPLLDEEGWIISKPESIIATKEKIFRTRVIKEYIKKWKNIHEEDASWESKQFRQLHPSLPSLWGQAPLKGVEMLQILNDILQFFIIIFIKVKGDNPSLCMLNPYKRWALL